jgi:hypothetical protein
MVDAIPQQWRFRAYQGDPFDFQIHLTNPDGSPADVVGWSWAAQIDLGPGLLPFETTGREDGVDLYLRGDETLRLPARYCPFDVKGRNPLAGDGHTVLRGIILAAPRVTVPPIAAQRPTLTL